jgi:biopolymer transport protein ExbB
MEAADLKPNPERNTMTRARLASLLLLACGLTSAPAFAWWNAEWTFRKEITVDVAAAGVTGVAMDTPVLVRLSPANFPFFGDARPDGADLRAIAGDDQTPLSFHVEKFDPVLQMALVWVRLPKLPPDGNAKFYLYYGNPEAQSAGDPAQSYDAAQSLVYHFATGNAPFDSTGYRSEATAPAGTPTPNALIGGGLTFDGSAALAVPAAPPLRIVATQGLTMSAWVKATPGQTQATVIAAADGTRELALGIDGDRAFARWRNGTDVLVQQPEGSSVTGDWHHLALRATAETLTLLVDGVVAGQAPVQLADTAAGLAIGAGLRGDIDEVQVAGAPRDDAWLLAAAQSQGMIAPLVVYGGDETNDDSSDESYFASTLNNVTVDGWVIIGILAVLFFYATLVMILKLVTLGRVTGGNAKFLEEYYRQKDDPSALERGLDRSGGGTENRFGSSTLWDLYHRGMSETLKRLQAAPPIGESDGRTSILTAQSIEAIRAAMDASLIRSTQKMQSQMVWLTIAISGGPFLGLLGTVVGVMITFAAIAASGEVNINAIAPGTAAALVATVAGLAVAIPCLFGYNYLNTRIKEVVADMRVFVDEFVARIAETYS